MVGEETKTNIPVYKKYMEAGFDPTTDLLQGYYMMGGDLTSAATLPYERLIIAGCGGLLVDWDLRTTLEGLYSAGETSFANHGHAQAACTGRWVGRIAADYAQKTSGSNANRKQIDIEKERVYKPLQRTDGVDWKELNIGACRVMQSYCCEPKTERLMKIGLGALKELKDEDAEELFATDPHKLGRAIDTLDVLTCDEIVIHSCLARKASSKRLGFKRLDCPENDPQEWHKFVTVRLEGEMVKVGERSVDYYEPLKDNFEARRGK
jgi:succinate dehydrogenase/fumarate reductase flavoprotein subunit